MDKLRIGLAGCGSVSQRGLIPHLAQDDIGDRVIFQAVMDPVEGRAAGIAEGIHKARSPTSLGQRPVVIHSPASC